MDESSVEDFSQLAQLQYKSLHKHKVLSDNVNVPVVWQNKQWKDHCRISSLKDTPMFTKNLILALS